jgi:hypothetical protein
MLARVRILQGKPLLAVAISAAAISLIACGGSSSSSSTPKATSSTAATSVVAGTTPASGSQSASVPKVPFSNDPCQSLSATDETTLGFESSVTAKADKAPSGLPLNNVCSYTTGGTLDIQVGYQVKIDYTTNQSGNMSAAHAAPSDLPGAFYDKQGGLWFNKNGYYVVVSGGSRFVEQAASIIAAKL